MKLIRKRGFEEYVALAGSAYALYRQAEEQLNRYNKWKANRKAESYWTLRIYESDQPWLFGQVASWVLRQQPRGPQSDITVGVMGGKVVPIPPDEPNIETTVEFEGEWIPAAIRTQKDESNTITIKKVSTVRFVAIMCSSEEQRDRLINFFTSKVAEQQLEATPDVFRSGSTGSLRWVKSLPKRPLDTVFLPDGMLDDIVNDVTRFFDSRQEYFDRGIPYHRGILLHGPAGTGKTSTVCSIASHFGKSVSIIPLTELTSDSALVTAVSEVNANSIVVLEDVDVFRNTHARQKNGQGGGEDGKSVTLEGLLNVLDGLMTPDGMLTFMTTNHPEHLDPALIRPGRVDRKFELGYMTQNQLDQMIKRFIGDYHIEMMNSGVTPAQVMECLKAGFDIPTEQLLDNIRKVVAE